MVPICGWPRSCSYLYDVALWRTKSCSTRTHSTNTSHRSWWVDSSYSSSLGRPWSA
jgi:hypothetical protein